MIRHPTVTRLHILCQHVVEWEAARPDYGAFFALAKSFWFLSTTRWRGCKALQVAGTPPPHLFGNELRSMHTTLQKCCKQFQERWQDMEMQGVRHLEAWKDVLGSQTFHFRRDTLWCVRDISLYPWMGFAIFPPPMRHSIWTRLQAHFSGLGQFPSRPVSEFVDCLYYGGTEMFRGEVEINRSLFCRRCKYHRGDPRGGSKVWILGMVERATKRIILYPVDKRDEATLIPLIKRHVEKGTTI